MRERSHYDKFRCRIPEEINAQTISSVVGCAFAYLHFEKLLLIASAGIIHEILTAFLAGTGFVDRSFAEEAEFSTAFFEFIITGGSQTGVAIFIAQQQQGLTNQFRRLVLRLG